MSDTMIDRVADRLASWLRPGLDAKNIARVVLAETREPTETMIRAAEWVEGYAEITRQTTSVAAQVWRDMAGAILAEPHDGQGNDT